MKTFNQIFFKGLIVVLPISLTFYLLFWTSIKIENLFGSLIKFLIGKELYLPGSGIVLTIVFVFLVGILVTNYLTAGIFKWFTDQMEKFPLIKAIYNPLKDLMALLPGRNMEGAKPQKVVLVPWGDQGAKVMGLVTREDLDEINLKNFVSVYVPLSYMLGGFTLLVPLDKLEVVDLPIDQALKLSITSWVKAKSEK